MREQMRQHGDPNWPAYGHVVNVQAQRLIWVRDHLGGEQKRVTAKSRSKAMRNAAS
ncbi:hypothetical protein H7I76_14525 [Mycolicibacterium vaccae]|nr:hypothetical protein [Mycolicibacterium vaccae]